MRLRTSAHSCVPIAAACATLALGDATTARAEPVTNGAIAFSAARAADRVIYTKQPNGTGLRLIATGGRSDHPAISPRGLRVAFTRYGPLGAQIVISYLNGVGLRTLTTGPSDTMAAWSPTGAALVFVRSSGGQRDLYRIEADGAALRRLTSSRRNDESPAWSVTNQLAFVRRAGKTQDIYTLAAGGGVPRRLTRSREPDLAPAWSPTGQTLVFTRGRPGRRDLYVIRADGSGARRLTRVPGDESDPTWSPDGTRIAFTHSRAGKRRLYLMKRRGKPVQRLARRSLRVRQLTSTSSAARAPSWQPSGLDPVVAAAGDIACDPANQYFNGGLGQPGLCRQKLTSDLLLRSDLSSILIPGDVQYERGELSAFLASFHPTWGRLKPLIRPAPGNHEYGVPGAAGYFDYFNGPGQQTGPAGQRGAGWYSFEVGSWHVIALNSECEFVGGCDEGSAQLRWLRADLAAHPATCTLAFWHGPRFTSGRFDDHSEDVRPFWDVLYGAGADVVLVGHEHFYERFAPQTPDGGADPARGIRQFTVGMGGKSRFGFVTALPNSEVRDNATIGVAELTLRPGRYDWRLVKAPTGDIADSGSGPCH